MRNIFDIIECGYIMQIHDKEGWHIYHKNLEECQQWTTNCKEMKSR